MAKCPAVSRTQSGEEWNCQLEDGHAGPHVQQLFLAPTPSSPSSVDVEPDTEHGMSSEELAGRFGAHFKPAAAEAGVEGEPDQSSSARADAVTQFEFHGTSPSSVEGAPIGTECRCVQLKAECDKLVDRAFKAESALMELRDEHFKLRKIASFVPLSAEAGVEVEREEAVEYLKWAEDWTPDTVARWREARKRKKGK